MLTNQLDGNAENRTSSPVQVGLVLGLSLTVRSLGIFRYIEDALCKYWQFYLKYKNTGRFSAFNPFSGNGDQVLLL